MQKNPARPYILLAVALFVVAAVVVGILIKVSLDRNKPGTGSHSDAVVELVSENGEIVHKPVADFQAYLAKASGPVFVDFWAPWCGPCVYAAPFVESLAKAYAGKAHILKVNVDMAEDLARQYGASSIPLFVVIQDGRVADSQVGYAASIEDDIRGMIDDQIG